MVDMLFEDIFLDPFQFLFIAIVVFLVRVHLTSIQYNQSNEFGDDLPTCLVFDFVNYFLVHWVKERGCLVVPREVEFVLVLPKVLKDVVSLDVITETVSIGKEESRSRMGLHRVVVVEVIYQGLAKVQDAHISLLET